MKKYSIFAILLIGVVLAISSILPPKVFKLPTEELFSPNDPYITLTRIGITDVKKIAGHNKELGVILSHNSKRNEGFKFQSFYIHPLKPIIYVGFKKMDTDVISRIYQFNDFGNKYIYYDLPQSIIAESNKRIMEINEHNKAEQNDELNEI